MRAFVTTVCGITIVAFCGYVLAMALDGSAILREYGQLAEAMPPDARQQLDQSEKDRRREQQEARDKTRGRLTMRFGQLAVVAVTGCVLFLCEGAWLLAVWAGAGWMARQAAIRAGVKASMWGAIALPTVGVGVGMFVGGWTEMVKDPRTLSGLFAAAAFGAFAGGAIGAVWGALRFRK